MAALKMFVRQNTAADNGQVGIRAEEVVRELLHKRKQLVKRRAVNHHRRVLGVHDDGVLVVINVGRILKTPRLAVDRDRHDAKILPRRVRNRARVADIFDAEQAFGVTGGFLELCRRDIARVFLRLREIDGNFEFSIFRLHHPVLVLCDAVAADIVAVLAELVEVIGRRFRRFSIERPELPHDLGRPRCHAAHEPRVKQIALRNGVRDHSLLRRIIAEDVQTFWKTMAF